LKLAACRLKLAACGLWLAACGLWLVAWDSRRGDWAAPKELQTEPY